MVGGGDCGGGEDRGGGEGSDGSGIGRVGFAGLDGELAALGEVAALEEVVGGGEEPSGFGFGTIIMTRFITHFAEGRKMCTKPPTDSLMELE